MINHVCKHRAKTRHNTIAVCLRSIYVLCCNVVNVLQVVLVNKIVKFNLVNCLQMRVLYPSYTTKNKKQGIYQQKNFELKHVKWWFAYIVNSFYLNRIKIRKNLKNIILLPYCRWIIMNNLSSAFICVCNWKILWDLNNSLDIQINQ